MAMLTVLVLKKKCFRQKLAYIGGDSLYGAKFVNHANGAAGQSKAAKKIPSTGIAIAISVA